MKFKGKEGITLIALVVTIIVLVILAGVSINLIFGQYGIVTRAKESKDQTEQARFKEDIQLKLVDLQAQKKITGGKNITTAEIEETIIGAGGKIVRDENEEMIGVKVGETTIPIEEVTQGITIETPIYREYINGEMVTIGTESFYVIHDSGIREKKVTVITAKNINVSTLKQADNAQTVAFSTKNGFPTEVDLSNNPTLRVDTKSAIYYARKYAESITGNEDDGRLLLKEEVIEVTGSNGGYLSSYPRWLVAKSYWLGTAPNYEYVWYLKGSDASFSVAYFKNNNDFGVRPVIEISKSLIS